ncbi:MAG TPA: hypothetical protein VK830_01130 [Xanthomonadales bacterium]|nr:hypothetical protein [Xanthomonadales bacterium]
MFRAIHQYIRITAGLALMTLAAGLHAGIDKVTSTTVQPLRTPSSPIPAEALLDVGIPPFNDGLDLTDDDDTVFPEVRYAESIYFANQLAKFMERSGGWGAIRVTPNSDVVMDLYVEGKILQSDGETLDLEVRAYDTSGKQWLDKEYKHVTGKYAYDRRLRNLGDPFQNLFTEIANDLLGLREQMSHERALRLRQISELRFARDFSPEAFNEHISQERNGELKIARLPAENDSILQRVRKIRERDYLYVDTMQDYYDSFSRQMHLPYQDFRRASYDSVVKARQLRKQANRRMIAGFGAIIAGIYGRTQADSRLQSDAGMATAAVGGYLLKSALDRKQESAEHTEAVAEMGSSLEAEIVPQVIELEDRTITLTGSVQAQYQQWRELLHRIYEQERMTP